MSNRGVISEALRRKGVAAETITEALGDTLDKERKRIIAALAQCPTDLDRLIQIKVDAMAVYKLSKELELGLNHIEGD
jgi:SOS response regulatory protein OraA/RecX